MGPPPGPLAPRPPRRQQLQGNVSVHVLDMHVSPPPPPPLHYIQSIAIAQLEIRAADCSWTLPVDSSSITPRLDPRGAAPQAHRLSFLASTAPPSSPTNGQQGGGGGAKEEAVTRRLRRHNDYLLPGSRVLVRVRAIRGCVPPTCLHAYMRGASCLPPYEPRVFDASTTPLSDPHHNSPNAGMASPALAARFLHAPIPLSFLRADGCVRACTPICTALLHLHLHLYLL